MKNIKAIIGGGYGEEGKGLFTRYFAINSKNPIIIFYQGSTNRQTTIEKIYGPTISLSHFGAGVLDNIPTFFGNNFIIDPIIFCKEYYEIINKFNGKYKPISFVDKNCGVITPIDKVLDKFRLYALRNIGIDCTSCCAGTHSYTDRVKDKKLLFTYDDFLNNDPIEICKYIYDNWFFKYIDRYKESKGMPFLEKYLSFNSNLNFDDFYEQSKGFSECLKIFSENVPTLSFNNVYNNYNSLIFQSSVGLGMSIEKNELNKTSSNVGIKNIIELLKDKDDYSAEICYITRSYLVKHSGGDFPEENKNLYFEDLSNTYNFIQGPMRFGDLNYEEFINRCQSDFSQQKNNNWIMTTGLTHANELYIKEQNKFNYISKTKFAEDIERINNG